MRVKLLLVSALALPALISCGAPKKLTGDQYTPILDYYANCTYVAENSTPLEIMQFASMLKGTLKNEAGPPSDVRSSKVYAAMAATMGTILEPDPGILWPGTLTITQIEQYFYSFTPGEVMAVDNASVSMRVTRTSMLPLTRPAQPAASTPGSLVKPYTQQAFTATEVDDWVKVDGRWRLKAVHAYLVGG